MLKSLSSLRAALDDVSGEVFKMVVGTSTGALMAFGLLHGESSFE